MIHIFFSPQILKIKCIEYPLISPLLGNTEKKKELSNFLNSALALITLHLITICQATIKEKKKRCKEIRPINLDALPLKLHIDGGCEKRRPDPTLVINNFGIQMANQEKNKNKNEHQIKICVRLLIP